MTKKSIDNLIKYITEKREGLLKDVNDLSSYKKGQLKAYENVLKTIYMLE